MKQLLYILLLNFAASTAWAVISPEQVAYDHYFDAATFAVEAEVSADTMAYWLLMTYDEGRIQVPQGSELTLHLRDRTTIVLTTDRELRREDIMLRRWRDRTQYYITCRYPITHEQLNRIISKDAYRLEIQTSQGLITRSVRGLNAKLSAVLKNLPWPCFHVKKV